MKHGKIVSRTAAVAAAFAVAGAAAPATGVAPVSAFAGPPAFAQATASTPSPPTPICTPSWGSIVLPICV
jgi:hypothetical protein